MHPQVDDILIDRVDHNTETERYGTLSATENQERCASVINLTAVPGHVTFLSLIFATEQIKLLTCSKLFSGVRLFQRWTLRVARFFRQSKG